MKKYLKNPAYKLMFFIGIIDLITIQINGILTGFLTIIGAVFCTLPNFLYICGSFGTSNI